METRCRLSVATYHFQFTESLRRFGITGPIVPTSCRLELSVSRFSSHQHAVVVVDGRSTGLAEPHLLPVGEIPRLGDRCALVPLGVSRPQADPVVAGLEDTLLLGQEGLVVVRHRGQMCASGQICTAIRVSLIPGCRVIAEFVADAVLRTQPSTGTCLGSDDLCHIGAACGRFYTYGCIMAPGEDYLQGGILEREACKSDGE